MQRMGGSSVPHSAVGLDKLQISFPQGRGICCVWPGERSLVLSGPEGRKVVVPHGQAVVACKDTGSVYPQLVNFTFDAGRERNLSAATLLLVRDAMSAVCRLCSWSL